MTSIFVAKLDFGVTGEQLKTLFSDYGPVIKANVATDKETGKSRGFGFVEMANREDALKAISSLDGKIINGRPLAVKEAEQRSSDNRPKSNNFSRPDFRNKPNESFSKPPNDSKSKGLEKDLDFIPRAPKENADFTSVPVIAIDNLKNEPRKKKEDKKSTKDWDADRGAKKPKMNAYKKSGKSNNFFNDDEDDWDEDLLNYKKEDEEVDFYEDDENEDL
jgi:RNA recognition motif-containing protein